MSTKTTSKSKMNPTAMRQRQERLDADLEQRKLAQKHLEWLTEERDKLIKTDLTGLAVLHKQFGKGTVREQDALTVTVQFADERRRFGFPSAFLCGFLVSEDKSLYQNLGKYQKTETAISKRKSEILKLSREIEKLEQ